MLRMQSTNLECKCSVVMRTALSEKGLDAPRRSLQGWITGHWTFPATTKILKGDAKTDKHLHLCYLVCVVRKRAYPCRTFEEIRHYSMPDVDGAAEFTRGWRGAPCPRNASDFLLSDILSFCNGSILISHLSSHLLTTTCLFTCWGFKGWRWGEWCSQEKWRLRLRDCLVELFTHTITLS